jgi:hypothetical protein
MASAVAIAAKQQSGNMHLTVTPIDRGNVGGSARCLEISVRNVKTK